MKKYRKALISGILCLALMVGIVGTGMAASSDESKMKVGVGSADITGPITDISTGYNSLGDLMEGLLMRLNARAFVVETDGKPMVYVSAELVHMTESIKPGVIKELAKRGLSQYTEENVMLAATHCHSSTSNVSWYPLYDLINGVPGYDDESYNLIVKGIADAIEIANDDLAPGRIQMSYADTDINSYNRSLNAYSHNINYDPTKYGSDFEAAANAVNKEMVALRFTHDKEGDIGLLSFFGSHGTSNNMDNTYVAADHKGYACYYIEQQMGNGFVAAIAQNECGDVSPNKPQADDVKAAFSRPNDLAPEQIEAIENEIYQGQQEADAALKLLKGGEGVTTIDLTPTLDSNYTTVDFSNIKVDKQYIGEYYMPYDDIDNAATSEPCIGAAIIAGDEEGAPVDNAEEGSVRHDFEVDPTTGEVVRTAYDFSTINLYGLQKIMGKLWPTAMKILQSDAYDDAQMEKVVCLAVGNLMQKNQPLQVFQVGELAIVGVPFEITTEQGRRTKEVLQETLAQKGVKKVIFSTLTNAYSQYLTTREEYAAQDYEGSTCLFGPWSGAALTQELDSLCKDMVNGVDTEVGPGLRQTAPVAILKTPAAAITTPADKGTPGAAVAYPAAVYTDGDTVTASFQGANPRHITDLRLAGNKEYDDYSFMTVEKMQNGKWVTYKDDADPYTTISFKKTGINKTQATLGWLLRNPEPGVYRFRYNCVYKVKAKSIRVKYSYTLKSVTSGTFTVK